MKMSRWAWYTTKVDPSLLLLRAAPFWAAGSVLLARVVLGAGASVDLTLQFMTVSLCVFPFIVVDSLRLELLAEQLFLFVLACWYAIPVVYVLAWWWR